MTEEIRGLRILMVTPRYFPYMGGIETHVHEVGRRLARHGADITLLTTMPYGFPTLSHKRDNVEGMRILRVRAWPRQRDYYFAPEIYTMIARGRWDLIHCQGCHTCVPPLALLAASRASIPYVVTFHTGGHTSRLRSSMRGMQWRLLRPLLANASRLIGVSRFEADYFRDTLHLPAQRFSVISNGATLPDIPQAPQRAGAALTIISVGRLERYKGHQRIISAFPKIRERYPEARLLILGTGPYEVALRTLAQRAGIAESMEIRAIPAANRQEMAETLARAALVVLLSEYEAHPIAVMEALALQRPVLVTNTSGLRELAEQGLVQAVALDSSPQEIAQAALQLIEAPPRPQTQLALPTWDDCTRQVEAIYSMVTRRGQCAS
ncbi:MAG: glycosyltransferase family 4 protein [Chloroflexota bacterium]|nr:glycosyltransferase family 4 protein [Chloroflexota bacterium]